MRGKTEVCPRLLLSPRGVLAESEGAFSEREKPSFRPRTRLEEGISCNKYIIHRTLSPLHRRFSRELKAFLDSQRYRVQGSFFFIFIYSVVHKGGQKKCVSWYITFSFTSFLPLGFLIVRQKNVTDNYSAI